MQLNNQSKPVFKLDLEKLNEYPNIDYISNCKSKSSETNWVERLKEIEEENVRLREVNEQLSRTLSMTTRSLSFRNNTMKPLLLQNNTFQVIRTNQFSSLTSRDTITNPLAKNIKETINRALGERTEIALSVNIYGEEYYLGLEPTSKSNAARVVLLRTPSFWKIHKLPQFWLGLSNIVSSVINKGLLKTLSYWSFLPNPPNSTEYEKEWEAINLKYIGPNTRFKGYSLIANDDGLFVCLQSKEDSYETVFYSNKLHKQNLTLFNNNMEDYTESFLNLLHASTQQYLNLDPRGNYRQGISIKLSDNNKNQLLFKEITTDTVLTTQLMQQSTNYTSLESELSTYKEINSYNFNKDKDIYTTKTTRTVEPCSSIGEVKSNYNLILGSSLLPKSNNIDHGTPKSLSDNNPYSLYSENNSIMAPIDNNLHTNIYPQTIKESSPICSPRIRAHNVLPSQHSLVSDYHEVPLNRRLNIVYVPSTTPVLVHDLVDSEDDFESVSSTDRRQISDVELEYFEYSNQYTSEVKFGSLN
ncbi:uncharacterized protein CMU_001230 [Cryptosporidium muris RN66]|uniref:Uncharacterized protein n=1 Tax=Cryptosporidium muris (strain RN66) TaxID=441375 RepID=B6AGB1_CRYMR|nr:uncharacterized protein CMU_001230 [Cryptosporidium muris RN66]EEA07252.1 hypothetical protein, conserved [Cryptosporidium muris RN66]|eukprot:XP_002141601.1 hypothetical protein [Cryptosporidium muris RN66]